MVVIAFKKALAAERFCFSLMESTPNQKRRASHDVAFAVPVQTDHAISSSGLSVNNSSTIALEFEGSTNNKIYYSFLVYTGLARVFLSQVTTKI